MENCKLPILEDRQYIYPKKSLSKKNISLAVLFASFGVLLIILLLSIIYLLCEISQLKTDVEDLRTSYSHADIVADLNRLKNTVDNYHNNDDRLVFGNYDDDIPIVESSGDYADDYSFYDDEEDDEDDAGSDHRLLTGGQFTKDIKDRPQRQKRNIVGYTEDGVPINSEPFAEAKQRNGTKRHHHHSSHSSTETRPATSTSRPVYSRRSRVMLQEDKSKAFRQFVKKSSLKSGDQNSQEDSEIEFTIVKNEQVEGGRHRQRQEDLDERPARIGRMRPLPTAHFHGDTSKYTLGVHDNFNGDGHLRHPQKFYVDWLESSWFKTLGMDRHFSFDEGALSIKDSGLYFVYAQIYYYDEHDINGFMVYKNNKILLQCTTMTHSMKRVMKGNTCYTAAAEYLQEGDRITLGDISESRYSMFEPGKSFFGVIKLGDVKIK